MAPARQSKANLPAEIARQLHEALLRERIVPRFVDTYVLQNSRQALQVHAVMYRDLLALLQREALLELSVRALEIVCDEPRAQGRSKPRPMPRREAALFRKKFLAALVRQQGWSVGQALDFQRDFQLYEDLLSRTPRIRRSHKPFEAANHPYVDRCAFLLDSSFLEQARVAASRTLTELENLAAQVCEAENSDNKPGLKN
ncbi:MAG TPA: hypothetical protein VJN89_04470 [Candidatus Acidoferrum sp.]|nr:hypothetical protein [Candidatus Acidoferrum sp.]